MGEEEKELTASEFIAKINAAPFWTMTRNPVDNRFRLYIVEDDEPVVYITPTAFDMVMTQAGSLSAKEVFSFLSKIETATGGTVSSARPIHFYKSDPYFDENGRAEAISYTCSDPICGWKLITLASELITGENAELLAQHKAGHGD